ncbi:S41 family peptidase [Lysobacter capsici]|uniref:S41 family peptidase n=1 Tax=Lysobacter capsici TaxID=435897 RepID=UPI00287B9B0D|nr:S41 family peptidase [Lysobacter capsici]WND81485.1 S41 family peptidase [Lysobacter capsici]WND86681.1 S41 family peptidase [Lysobacter capsici]
MRLHLMIAMACAMGCVFAPAEAAESGAAKRVDSNRSDLNRLDSSKPDSAQASQSRSAATAWNIHSASGNYQGQGEGDPTDAKGASLRLIGSAQAKAGESGVASVRIDAAPLRGRRLRLSARLTVDAAPKGALLWIRADGADKKVLGFINSQRDPVAGEHASAARELLLDVPDAAEQLLFGLVLLEGGQAAATELRLVDEGRSATAQDVFDFAIEAIKDRALHRDRIDWGKTDVELRARLAAGSGASAAYPVLRELIGRLGDGHSFLMPPQATRDRAGTAKKTFEPVVKPLAGAIGYVAVPGFSGGDDAGRDAFARGIVERIAVLAPSASAGWIVDLRGNSGGTMWPMLAGLRPLLGAGAIGGNVSAPGQPMRRWRPEQLMPNAATWPQPDLRAAKVAVLIGPRTSSSGEAVAIAFSGRARTRSFGQPSDGRSTSNETIALPDGGALLLTTAVFADRSGKLFGGRIEPDVAVPAGDGDGNSDASDPALAAAQVWLASDE